MAEVSIKVPTFEVSFDNLSAEGEDDVWNDDEVMNAIQERAYDLAIVVSASYDEPQSDEDENDEPSEE